MFVNESKPLVYMTTYKVAILLTYTVVFSMRCRSQASLCHRSDILMYIVYLRFRIIYLKTTNDLQCIRHFLQIKSMITNIRFTDINIKFYQCDIYIYWQYRISSRAAVSS